ncbi:hypothetical protein BC938DRAFT_474287 [Jimgerdemannia flammicorona]|uniref:Uncharacterized protein n=1 Tax=Jimgerdemannia flammicorona TaxID=994334 RepID=A0A433Q2I8_9FUNG|nr:hypothetical protein BC938DRAFT_474287 [Jimgerdemannia flammicorona]
MPSMPGPTHQLELFPLQFLQFPNLASQILPPEVVSQRSLDGLNLQRHLLESVRNDLANGLIRFGSAAVGKEIFVGTGGNTEPKNRVRSFVSLSWADCGRGCGMVIEWIKKLFVEGISGFLDVLHVTHATNMMTRLYTCRRDYHL